MFKLRICVGNIYVNVRNMCRYYSSDIGFGRMPFGGESGIAVTLPLIMNGFNFRFVFFVTNTQQSPPSEYESTTCVACDFVSVSWFGPKHAVGKRRCSAST